MGRIRNFFRRITGFSTPFFGMSWSAPSDSKRESDNQDIVGVSKDRTLAFNAFIEELVEWPDEPNSPKILDPEFKDKKRVLNWTEAIDDEILLVVNEMVKLHQNHSYTRGVTQAWLSMSVQPLGIGRSFDELVEKLLKVGILAPSTEEIHERTYAAIDAKANPSWDFGRMFYGILPYVELFDLDT